MSLSTITHAVAAFIVGVLVWFFQSARLGAELADERLQVAQYREQVTTEHAAANARVAQAGQQVAKAYQGALNDAIKTQATLQAAATRAGRERDSLREQAADAARRLAEAPPAAVLEYATAANELFVDCSRRYTELAEKADGHATDVRTLTEAWPSPPSPEPG